MSVGLYRGITGLSGAPGLSLLTGSGLSGGTGLSGDAGPTLGTPTLIMDFAPSDADSDWVALDLNFMTETYEVYVPDAGVTDRVNILLWS